LSFVLRGGPAFVARTGALTPAGGRGELVLTRSGRSTTVPVNIYQICDEWANAVPQTLDRAAMVADASDIETPALIVDLDAMEANAASMARLVSEHDIQLRPNVKGHKVPALAWRQLRLGAAGITCQKLSEAQVMVDAGLPDVLVAVQVIGAS